VTSRKLAAAWVLAIGSVVISLGDNPFPSPCSPSSYWGARGERWKPESVLPDFSYAGYRAGERAIPNASARWDLKRDFHAVGNGSADDTEALERAVRSVSNGVLFIPEGRYVITRKITIDHGNLVLRGAGRGKTIFYFPRSLTDLYGNNPDNEAHSEWSFGPGFIHVNGKNPLSPRNRIASVVQPARRGDRQLALSEPLGLEPAAWITLAESDPAKGTAYTGSLIRFLYGDLMPAGEGLIGTPNIVRFLSRVRSRSGNLIELERPLPYDVRLEWKPEIHTFSPSIEEFGIEHLSFRFPWSPYLGHFKEKGFNALTLDDVSQCWIRDVEIQNADFGIGLNQTNFCTVSGVVLTTSQDRAVSSGSKGMNGHHGIDVGHGTENLITNFDIHTTFVHDISVEWYALHTVFSNGSGTDLAMDHHREANYSNLFSNLNCGRGTRPFASGGSHDRGAHAGAYTTYWNIRAESPMNLPPPDFGPLLNFIGFEAIPKLRIRNTTGHSRQSTPDTSVPPIWPALCRSSDSRDRSESGHLTVLFTHETLPPYRPGSVKYLLSGANARSNARFIGFPRVLHKKSRKKADFRAVFSLQPASRPL